VYDEQPNDPSAQGETTATGDDEAVLARLTGQRLGAYLVRERLGGGAHSTVYRAARVDPNGQVTDEVVALKILLPGADAATRTRFHHEARTATALDHPHIVRTIQVGEAADDDVAFIAMELAEGISLGELLERQLQLSVLDACSVLEPIACALAYAHEQGVVHRDVKPSNILLRRAEAGAPGSITLAALDYPVTPLLSDFGIARAMDAPELTSVGRTIGTPAYMSPEQCEGGREVDGRADIYSLGAVFYRCLVGRPPYTGSTTQILYAHVYSPLTIPDDVLVKLPIHVINILRRSLAKDPDQRYPSAQLMADDLALIAGRRMAIGPDDAVDAEDATRTMTSLPVPAPRTETASILIPAKREGTTRTHTLLQPRGGPRSGSSGQPSAPRKRRFGSGVNMLWLAISIVMVTLLFVVVVGSRVRNASPAGGGDLAQVVTPGGGVADGGGEGGGGDDGAEGGAGGSAPAATATLASMPAINVHSAWDDAFYFYTGRDWKNAQEQLTLLLRTDPVYNRLQQTSPPEDEARNIVETFLDQPDAEFWQRVDGLFTPDELAAMLFDIYVGLGMDELGENRPARAAEYFQMAMDVKPDAPGIAELLAATQAYVSALPVDKPAARQTLHEISVALAEALAEEERYCAASEQMDAALGLVSSQELIDLRNDYQTRCVQELEAQQTPVVDEDAAFSLRNLTGRLLYSTQDQGRYFIYSVAAHPLARSFLLVNDGRLPDMPPTGNRLAFYSTRPNDRGLSGVDLFSGLGPDARSIHYTTHDEDAAESPATWNPLGNRLTFASRREGDKVERVFVTWADGDDDNTTMLAFGGEPVWHPSLDVILYNGVDNTGNRPGLWLIRSDGTNARRLTNVRTDIRPSWSPGGQYIVFTSATRDGNWEIYRLDLTDMSTIRLTDNPAQDVLPAVDPSGAYVAFMSDRGGSWAIWVTPVNGGPVQKLTNVVGDDIDWLEHSMQWIP
jgi:serine/threonine protein kinase